MAGRLCITALLCSVALFAQTSAPPDSVKPFPSGLTGTLVFQSDKPGADNPDARNHIFTLDLADGRGTQLTSGRNHHDQQQLAHFVPPAALSAMIKPARS